MPRSRRCRTSPTADSGSSAYGTDAHLAADNLTALQGVAATLEEQDMPLGIIYAPKVSAVASLPKQSRG